MPTTTPFLWFDTQAEEAATLYTTIFPNSEIRSISRYQADTPGTEGGVMTVEISLDGQPYVLLNGGPQFQFTEAVSFQISCADQAEIDHYWFGLTADGGQESQCGWLKDRFGLSWQVVSPRLFEFLRDPDPGRSQRAMQAMLQMRRIDLAELATAADRQPE